MKIPTVKEFLGKLELGFDFFQAAGEQLCKMKADNFDVFDDILAQCNWISRDMLETLLLIGRKLIHPRVLLLPSHVYSKVCGLPYEEQLHIVSAPVEIPAVIREGSLRAEERIRKPAANLSRSEADRVWPSSAKAKAPNELSPPSPKFKLCTELKMMDFSDDAPDEYLDVVITRLYTNLKAQVIILDENGCAVVQFRRQVKP